MNASWTELHEEEEDGWETEDGSELMLQISNISSLIKNCVAEAEREEFDPASGYSLIMLKLHFNPLVADRNENLDIS